MLTFVDGILPCGNQYFEKGAQHYLVDQVLFVISRQLGLQWFLTIHVYRIKWRLILFGLVIVW